MKKIARVYKGITLSRTSKENNGPMNGKIKHEKVLKNEPPKCPDDESYYPIGTRKASVVYSSLRYYWYIKLTLWASVIRSRHTKRNFVGTFLVRFLKRNFD